MSYKNRLRKILSLIFVITFLFGVMPQRNIQAQNTLPAIEDYFFRSSWGGEGKQILYPQDVVVTEDGKVYILNTEFNRITILDQNGYIYKEIGGFGEDDGEFNLPLGIAIYEAGEIFVSDTWNRRIQKFDNKGNHLLTFGTFGEGEGEIFAPQGMTIDAYGNLLVADGNNKIIQFTSNGEYISEWGTTLSEPGSGVYEFDRPSDIDIDNQGNIYVVDNSNSRIQIFNNQMIYQSTINTIDDGFEFIPQGVAIDNTGQIYVTGNDQIFIYDTNHDLIDTWGGTGTDDGQLNGPSGIDIQDSTGDLYVTDSGNDRVQVFDQHGQYKTAFGQPDMVDGYFYYPRDATINNNKVYVTDSYNDRIQVFNEDGTFLFKWGTYGSNEGQFDEPYGIDTDSAGNIYVVDSNNNRIQKFDANGTFISASKPIYADLGEFTHPKGITIDDNGNVFITLIDITNIENNRTLKFNNNMELQTEWQQSSSSIAVDSQGNIYMPMSNYIEVFDNNGVFLRKWGEEPGYYKGLSGIAIDSHDDVYTMDLWNAYIKKFTNDGILLGEFGAQGNGPGEFAYGSEMAITDEGVLYVVDDENQRVQVISPTLPEPDADSGLVLNGGFDAVEVASELNSGDRQGNYLMKLIQPESYLSGARGAVAGLDYWVYGGSLPIARSTHVSEGHYSLQLGQSVEQKTQGINEAWTYQVIYVRPELIKPVLTFNYNVFTNDSIEKSNFITEIQDGVGLNNLDVIVLDGYVGATPDEIPTAGTDLGWKNVEYDLSPFRGQYVRLAFGNRNLYPDSLGVWTFVEEVGVKDDSMKFYFPIMKR